MQNNKKTDFKRPCVYFSTEDEYLLEHALKQNNNFAAYVRGLIKKDMNIGTEEQRLKKIVISAIEEYVKTNGNVIAVSHEEVIGESPEFLPDEVNELASMVFKPFDEQ